MALRYWNTMSYSLAKRPWADKDPDRTKWLYVCELVNSEALASVPIRRIMSRGRYQHGISSLNAFQSQILFSHNLLFSCWPFPNFAQGTTASEIEMHVLYEQDFAIYNEFCTHIPSVGSNNGLAPDMWQDITWNIDHPLGWCVHASSGTLSYLLFLVA